MQLGGGRYEDIVEEFSKAAARKCNSQRMEAQYEAEGDALCRAANAENERPGFQRAE